MKKPLTQMTDDQKVEAYKRDLARYWFQEGWECQGCGKRFAVRERRPHVATYHLERTCSDECQALLILRR